MIVITGASGLLGRTLIDVCEARNIDYVPVYRTQEAAENNVSKNCKRYVYGLDVSSNADCLSFVKYNRDILSYSTIIHCAAITQPKLRDLEKSIGQTEARKICFDTNVKGTARLCSAICMFFSTTRVFVISSDYVFDGTKLGGMYTVQDVPNPPANNFYALTKFGQECTCNPLSNTSIIRTSFFDDTVKVWPHSCAFHDQYTSRMGVHDIANQIINCATSKFGVSKIMHLGRETKWSVYEMAKHYGYSPASGSVHELMQKTKISLPVDTSLEINVIKG